MTNHKASRRIHGSILAGPEYTLLQAIAPRVPAWFTPDRLTVTGLVGCAVVMLGYWLARGHAGWLWLANFGLLIHWAGDSLDGTVARFRGIARPRYGFYLDQSIDTLGNLMIALGVGLSQYARLDLTLLMLATYHMLGIQGCARTIVDGEFHVAVGHLGPTELRIAIAAMNCAIMAFGAPTLLTIAGRALTWCDILLLVTSVGLLGLYASEMRRHLHRLAREDPQPRAN
jgi:archaetidylinositol phosphate synthase